MRLSGHRDLSTVDFFKKCFDYCKDHPVDWDIYGKGQFKESFEKEMSRLLGFQKAIFMPSGVMAQLIAMKIATQDNRLSPTIGLHPTSHLLRHEENAYKELHQFEVMTIGSDFEMMTVEHLQKLEKLPHAIILEIPYRHIGGDMPEWNELQLFKQFCKEKKIYLHLDGARLWETQSYYQKTLMEICAGFDSAYVSFYKGIGSTSGAMLLGNICFID